MPAPTIHAFAEKVALISGGDSAYGRAVALQLALQGCYVIVGTNGVEASALRELERLGTLAHAVEADVSTRAGAESLVAAASAMFGRIDLLVNCVEIPEASDDYDLAQDSAGKSVYLLVEAARPIMDPRPKPRIVNIFPDVDTAEASSDPVFAAAHHALAGLTASLAAARPSNYRVNGIAVSSQKPPLDGPGDLLFRPPTGVSPDDVARTALFLLSGEAVAVNGQIIYLK